MSERKLFGTDGIRGRANIHPMTCEVALALGRAVTWYFQRTTKTDDPVIVIGKDTRLSCYMLEQAFSSGVCSQGGRAILTGPLPTPGVAFVTQSMRACAGVMISASHNGFADNGIKIFDSTGHKLPDDVEMILERMVLDPDKLPKRIGGELGRASRLDEVIGRYIVKVKNALDDRYSLDGMRLVIDCANGAAYKVAPMVFRELGAEVFELATSPNGQNINLNCGALHPEACAQAVIQYRADLGICLDGDADRLIVVDGKGHVIDGDKIIGICARFLKIKNELGKSNEVVGTVMTNLGLEVYLKKIGARLSRTQVGDRYIIDHMRKSGALFGGEPSGHLVFKNFSTTGDGILSALKVIECLKFFDCSLDELHSQIELYPQLITNIIVKSKPSFDSMPRVHAVMTDAQVKLGSTGRILVRYSGTEPLARVMIEGEDASLVKGLSAAVAGTIAKEIGQEK
jgi:phosphoglucosamine mutase